jgi:hypothetical protein
MCAPPGSPNSLGTQLVSRVTAADQTRYFFTPSRGSSFARIPTSPQTPLLPQPIYFQWVPRKSRARPSGTVRNLSHSDRCSRRLRNWASGEHGTKRSLGEEPGAGARGWNHAAWCVTDGERLTENHPRGRGRAARPNTEDSLGHRLPTEGLPPRREGETFGRAPCHGDLIAHSPALVSGVSAFRAPEPESRPMNSARPFTRSRGSSLVRTSTRPGA